MKNLFLFFLILFLGSCIKEPVSGPRIPDGLMEVPSGFDWKMTNDKNVSLTVLDAEAAVVRIFSSFDGNLIASGTASVGHPFVTTVNLPHTQSTLFVQKIAAGGAVVEQTITVEQATSFLFPAVSPLRNTSGALRAVRVLPTFDKVMAPGDKGDLYSTANIAYHNVKVTNGYNGKLTFHWGSGQSSVVYIEGNVTITGMSNQEKPGNKIIVLDGATLTVTINSFTGIDVEVDEGGTFHSTKKWSLSNHFINAGTTIVDGLLNITSYGGGAHVGWFTNSGTFHAKSNAEVSSAESIFENSGEAQFDGNFLFNSNSTGSNSGSMNVTNNFDVTNFSTFDNSGSITAGGIGITASAFLTNACNITAGTLNSGNLGCTLHITEGAITTVNSLVTSGGLTLLLDQGAIFKTTTLNVYQLAASTPTGGTGRSLFLYDNGTQIHTSSFTGPIQVVSPNYAAEQSSYYQLTFSGGAAVVAAQTHSIPQTPCNGGVGVIGGGVDPEEDDEPNSFLPSLDGFNTLVFEDMWPKEGDYDMNDMVIAFNVAFFENASTISRMIIKGRVLAVGAGEPTHALALQLDLTPSANVASVTRSVVLEEGVFTVNNANGTETGSTPAIIPLFASASDVIAITYQRNNFINTDPVSGSHATPIEWTIDVRFTEPVAKADLTLNRGLNFFMVTNGTREKEVHLFGFEPTSKANTALFGTGDDNSLDGPAYSTHYGYPWGLVIPGSFRYPIEKAPLNQAFLLFDSWISSEKLSNADWYIPTGSNVNPAKLYPELP